MKILIIEDEYNLADAIKSVLKTEKYAASINTDGEEGLFNALSGEYDLIILDIMLPKIDGFTILKKIREEKINTKVIMLTAKSTIEDKMQGFNIGADDYLTKPFHIEELVARVNVQLRRKETQNHNIIEAGDLKLDINKLELICISNKDNINIIGKEFLLLEIFMRNINQVIPKEQLFNKIWGYNSDCELNSLEAYISFIRKKLKLIGSKTKIKTIRNLGYKLEVADEKVKK